MMVFLNIEIIFQIPTLDDIQFSHTKNVYIYIVHKHWDISFHLFIYLFSILITTEGFFFLCYIMAKQYILSKHFKVAE